MSSSRNNILATIGNFKPASTLLPIIPKKKGETGELLQEFTTIAISIGSSVFPVKDYAAVAEILQKEFSQAKRIVSNIEELSSYPQATTPLADSDPHSYENVELAILEGDLSVAENSAIWLSESKMGHRVLPFICQHLALVIRASEIVPHMHEAYDKLGLMDEGYGVFIAGPSKTADIEQSLVLGAHGPRSLTVFILEG